MKQTSVEARCTKEVCQGVLGGVPGSTLEGISRNTKSRHRNLTTTGQTVTCSGGHEVSVAFFKISVALVIPSVFLSSNVLDVHQNGNRVVRDVFRKINGIKWEFFPY